MRTGAPKKGVAQRSKTVGLLHTEAHKLTVSDEMGEMLEALAQPDVFAGLSEIEQRAVETMKLQYDRSRKIPTDQFQAYVTLTAEAESVWEEAKRNADFKAFQPYLEKIVDYNRKFAELWGYEDHPYNALLEDYEPGLTVRQLDEWFGQVKKQLVPLVAQVKDSGIKPDTSFLNQPFDKEKQLAFNRYIVQELGYDFNAGRLDETEHPFATGLNPGDVRITTRFKPDEVTFALFGTIHECGHALYEQNIAEEIVGDEFVHRGPPTASMNPSPVSGRIIHRHEPSVLEPILPGLQKHFPGQLDQVTVDQFYRAINKSEPSLIRIEADELTYNLHIMIRYEIEKQLIAGQIQVADLPEIWNAKYEEYLGSRPQHDGEGVLQDVHWSGGAFGYFPSYSLGNMYAAQIQRDSPRSA